MPCTIENDGDQTITIDIYGPYGLNWGHHCSKEIGPGESWVEPEAHRDIVVHTPDVTLDYKWSKKAGFYDIAQLCASNRTGSWEISWCTRHSYDAPTQERGNTRGPPFPDHWLIREPRHPPAFPPHHKRDKVPLPGNYGTGSSSLAEWIQGKMDYDNWVHDEQMRVLKDHGLR